MVIGSTDYASRALIQSVGEMRRCRVREGWRAAQPQLTALVIVGRLSEKYPEQSERDSTRSRSIR
jgi:hypothetical protein